MICAWLSIGAGRWKCQQCGRERTWKHAGSPPQRNCPPTSTPVDPTACLHRGETVRVEECQSCQGKIELPVYSCAVHGECTLNNHAARNPKLQGVHVCLGCKERKPGQPAVPSLIEKARNFAAASLRDRLNQRRRRSPELVARIFDQHCRVCPLYNADRGECSKCGCPVNATDPEANKLAWAGEQCPDGRWPIQRANLIYYLLPLYHPDDVWLWHVEQLRKRLHLFNGRKIVWIATRGPKDYLNIEPPEKVIEAFGDDASSIEFHQAANDKDHWETPAFRWMLRALAYNLSVSETQKAFFTEGNEGNEGTNSEIPSSFSSLPSVQNPSASEATFYFHAKGVRRAQFSTSIRPWCEAIYYHNLDRWDEVREILSVWPCCGIARQATNPTTMGGDGWHFAGTGFWFNHAALFGEGSGFRVQQKKKEPAAPS